MSEPLLAVVALAPLFGLLVVAFLPRREAITARGIAVTTGLVATVAAFVIAARLVTEPDLAREFVRPWIPAFGAEFRLVASGAVAPLLVTNAALPGLTLLAGWSRIGGDGVRGLHLPVGVLIAQAGAALALLAGDLLLLCVGHSLLVLGGTVLLSRSAGRDRWLAGGVLGQLGLTVAAALLAVVHYNLSDGQASTEISKVVLELAPVRLQWAGAVAVLVPVVFLCAVPPLHTWRLAEPEDGHAGLLHALAAPVAGHLLFRLAMPAFPAATGELAALLAVLGAAGVVWMGLTARRAEQPHLHVAAVGPALVLVAAGLATTEAVVGLYLLLPAWAVAVVLATEVPAGAPAMRAGVLALCGMPGLATFPAFLAVLLATFGQETVHFLQPAFVGIVALAGLALAAIAARRTDTPAPVAATPVEWVGRAALVSALVAGGLLPGRLADLVRPAARQQAGQYLQARCVGVAAGSLQYPAVRERLGVDCEDATGSLRRALREESRGGEP